MPIFIYKNIRTNNIKEQGRLYLQMKNTKISTKKNNEGFTLVDTFTVDISETGEITILPDTYGNE